MYPKESKSVYTLAPGKITLMTEPVRELAPDEVLVEVKCAGICGTDNGIYNGELEEFVVFPVRPGHEWTGVIKAVGAGVHGYTEGDRVVGETAHSCGVCDACVAGEKLKCTNWKSVGTVDAWPGAMTQYAIFAARDLIHLPDNISFEQGALIEPAANALMAIDDLKVTAGDTVVVMGTGPIGISAAAIARLYGATTVISVGRSPFKLDICKQLGATHVINTRETPNVEEEILKITKGKKVDYTIELSGAVELFKASLAVTKAKGTISMVAFYGETMEFSPNDIILAGVNIRTAGGGWGYFDKVIRLMACGALDLSPLITKRITLDEAPDEIVNLKKDSGQKIKIMICN